MTPIVFPKVPEKGASDEEWIKYDKNMQDVITRYINDAIAISLATSGYINFKNGLQLRWGSFTSTNDNDETVAFSSAFSNNCYAVVTSVASGTTITKTTSQFVFNRLDAAGGIGMVTYYIAIGS